MQTDYGASSLSQWAVTEWLSSGLYGLHLEQIRTSLRIRKDVTLKVLEEKLTGIAEWQKPSGGFYIWLRLPSTISLKELFDTALKEGNLLNPGNLYKSECPSLPALSYAYPSLEQLETGLKKLAEIIRILMKQL